MGAFEQRVMSFEEQAEYLEANGLQIENKRFAIHLLTNISYYRLSTYMMPYRLHDEHGKLSERFKPGTTWDDVYGLYIFDRKLRLLIFDAIERIEVALRTQIAWQLSSKYGTHWHDKDELFRKSDNIPEQLKAQIFRQLRLNNKGGGFCDRQKTPSSWKCMEMVTFGELSKICKGLKNRQDRTDIAKAFGVNDEEVFCSWLHTLNYIRNICAHHCRLWNISLNITPKRYYHKGGRLYWLTRREMDNLNTSKMYYAICIIIFIMQTVAPEAKFRRKFIALATAYPQLDLHAMGIPTDWKESRIWNY